MKGGSTMSKTLKLIISGVVFLTLAAQLVMAQEVYKFKISVDTVMDHPRNQGLLLFMEGIKKKSGGRLIGELFHSAQLYKSRDVPKALKLGTLEMGVPAVGVLPAWDINSNITALPMFYGRSPEATRSLADGEWGKAISESLEKKIGVKVLGRFYELGYVHILTVARPIEKIEDFKGLKIRYPVSPEFAMRITAFGANPMQVPLPDLPMALLQGTVDGCITNFKNADATKLDEAGIKYALKEYGQLVHYVPLVSNKFWNSLSGDLQKIMVEAWEEVVNKERAMSEKMQEEAEINLEKRGVKFYRPTEEERTKWRKYIMPAQDPFVKKMKYDERLIKLAEEKLGM
jgi:TRAP-type C4-dicarboxylate transport system substrate-binding protein